MDTQAIVYIIGGNVLTLSVVGAVVYCCKYQDKDEKDGPWTAQNQERTPEKIDGQGGGGMLESIKLVKEELKRQLFLDSRPTLAPHGVKEPPGSPGFQQGGREF